MKKEVLNKKEIKEISTDVKQAISKALEKNSYDNTMNQDEIDVKKFALKSKPSRKIPIIISVLIIIVIFLLGLRWFLSNNPRTIFFGSIDDFFEKIDLFTSSSNVKGEISISHNDQDNNNYIYYFDKHQGKLLIQDINNNFNIFVDNNKTYLYEPNINDNYVLYNNSKFPLFDLQQATEDLNKGLDKVLENQKFKTSSEDIKVSNKNISAIVTTLSLDKNQSTNVIENLKNYLQEEKDFVNFYNFISNNENAFDKAFISLKDSLTLKVYSTDRKNELVKVNLTTNDVSFNLTKNKSTYDYNLNNNLTNMHIFGNLKLLNKRVIFTKNTNNSKMRIAYTFEKSDKFKTIDVSKAKEIKSISEDKQQELISKYNNLLEDITK